MTRLEQRRQEIVDSYHRKMLVASLGFAIGAPVGLILSYLFAPEIDSLASRVLVWLVGGGAAVGFTLVLYFIQVLAFVAWIQFKRYDH
jgi:hypothetical protein